MDFFSPAYTAIHDNVFVFLDVLKLKITSLVDLSKVDRNYLLTQVSIFVFIQKSHQRVKQLHHMDCMETADRQQIKEASKPLTLSTINVFVQIYPLTL